MLVLGNSRALGSDALRFLPASLPDQRDRRPIAHGIGHRMCQFADQGHRLRKADMRVVKLAAIGEYARLA